MDEKEQAELIRMNQYLQNLAMAVKNFPIEKFISGVLDFYTVSLPLNRYEMMRTAEVFLECKTKLNTPAVPQVSFRDCRG